MNGGTITDSTVAPLTTSYSNTQEALTFPDVTTKEVNVRIRPEREKVIVTVSKAIPFEVHNY